MNARFVPVALKAALVNNPPDGEEGRLYREIGRSKPAPQGICVANSAGKVLDWALMFDDDQSVLGFLDYTLQRFREYPDAKRSVAAERYMKFPSAKLPDMADTGANLPGGDRHAGKNCPAQARFREGTIVARLVGRATDADGQPVADTVRQEHYVEDRFEVSVEAQELLARTIADAGTMRFKLPAELARLCVSHAFLGQIDVSPLGSPAGGSGDLNQCEFWAQKVSTTASPLVLLRIEGESNMAGGQDASLIDGQSDGRIWEHAVQLTWEGFVETSGSRMTRLLLAARGAEQLKWGNASFHAESDVARLPGGHPIDFAGPVCYGIIGEPVSPAEITGSENKPQQPDQLPPDAARQLTGALGPQFAIFLDVAQSDMQLADEQKKKLAELSGAAFQGFAQFMQQIQNLPEAEREKKHHEFREEANRRLADSLAKLLNPDQQRRLRQIMLQQEGLFALGNPEVAAELMFDGEQEKRFFQRIIEETQKRFQALQQKAQTSRNPEEIQREAARIRREQETKIEALLSDAQKEKWRAMLGKPLDLGS